MTILTSGGSFAKAYCEQFNAEVVSIRELDQIAFVDKLRQATVVIHNAATLVSDDLETLIERNFDFTRFVVRTLCDVNPTAHLVLLSSMSVLNPANSRIYGDVLTMSPYGYSKYLAETYCLKCPLERVSCARFSTLFFQDPQKDGLSKLISDAAVSGKIVIYNGGEARRNFLPIRIAAAYIHKIATAGENGKATYNLAAPTSTSFGEVAEVLKKLRPDLKIENQVASDNTTPVLAEFGTADIAKLGKVNFVLRDEIVSYYKELRP